MSNVSLRMVDHPWKVCGPSHVIHCRILHPLNFSGMTEDKSSNFVHGLAREVLVLWLQTVLQVGVIKVTWRLNFFSKEVLISRKRCKTEIYLQWKTNGKSHMAYEMAATAVTLNEVEGHSQVAGLLKCNPSNICVAFYTISTDSVLARFLCFRRASCPIKTRSLLAREWRDIVIGEFCDDHVCACAVHYF